MNTAAFTSQRIPLRISICRIPILGDILIRGFNGFAKGALSMAVTKKMRPEIAREYIASNRVDKKAFNQAIAKSQIAKAVAANYDAIDIAEHWIDTSS